MSTFHFKIPAYQSLNEASLSNCLQALKEQGEVESWNIEKTEKGQYLAVETLTISSEKLKHKLRETGIDVEFTEAPQA